MARRAMRYGTGPGRDGRDGPTGSRRCGQLVDREADGRVTQDDIVLRVVAFDPGAGQLLVARPRPRSGLVERVQQLGRERGEFLAEVPGGVADRLAAKDAGEAVAERDQLRPDARRADRVAP